MNLFPEMSGAIFSNCRKYRYQLWRQWDSAKGVATFVMLNPSTADETDNDPTVERCQRRAVQMGYGGLRVVNIFAFRSTYPSDLYPEADPVGPDNDAAIIDATRDAEIVVCAWGTHGKHQGRGNSVLELLRSQAIVPHFLKLNQDGTPKHPLYVGYAVLPQPFKFA